MQYNWRSKIAFMSAIVVSFFGFYNTASTKKSEMAQSCFAETASIDSSVKAFLQEELPKIMSAQEKKLGISYVSTPVIPLNLNEIKPLSISQEKMKQLFSLCALAIYDNERNAIYLNPNTVNYWCTCDDCFYDLNRASINPSQREEIKRIFNHELGHFYTDTLSEHLNKKDWPPKVNELNISTQDCIHYILSEGIAMYFMVVMGDKTEYAFKDSDWPNTRKEFVDIINGKSENDTKSISDIISQRFKLVYAGGYHFVTPIIDKYGAKGIEYLVRYNPKEEDITSLPKCQKRILEELEKKYRADKNK